MAVQQLFHLTPYIYTSHNLLCGMDFYFGMIRQEKNQQNLTIAGLFSKCECGERVRLLQKIKI